MLCPAEEQADTIDKFGPLKPYLIAMFPDAIFIIEPGTKNGEILLFHLSGASLRENMAATVLATIPSSKQLNVHLQFRDSNALMRIKLLQFLHRYKKQQAAA